MGDPRKIRKKYETPMHPWQRERIEEEKVYTKNFGLKNKKEIWKARSYVRKFTSQAKKLAGSQGDQAVKEKEQLLHKLVKLGLVKANAQMGDVLSLKVEDVLNRRLQTVLYKKNYARTIKQARQFIIHGHVMIEDQKVDVPSYLVSVHEEPQIAFLARSSLADAEHPERIILESAKDLKADIKKEPVIEELVVKEATKTEEQPVKESKTKKEKIVEEEDGSKTTQKDAE